MVLVEQVKSQGALETVLTDQVSSLGEEGIFVGSRVEPVLGDVHLIKWFEPYNDSTAVCQAVGPRTRVRRSRQRVSSARNHSSSAM